MFRSPKPFVNPALQLSPPACWTAFQLKNTLPAVEFFLRMKLITPATASEPYSAEAPSVRISTRSTASSGMLSRLTANPPPMLEPAFSACPATRCPSISTSVYLENSECNAAVVTPALAPLTESDEVR